MTYWGREIDTFQSALVMLSGSVPVYRHIDCISGRPFCLNSDSAGGLYSCTLDIERALKNLSEVMDHPFVAADMRDMEEEFVIELPQSIGAPNVIRKTYPFGHYVLCRRSGDKIIVNDPDGYPLLLCRGDEFPAGLPAVAAARCSSMTSPDKEAAIRKMRSYVKLHRPTALSERPSRVFLQYAVRNYICQTNRILEYILEYKAVRKTAAREMNRLFAGMLAVRHTEYHELTRIDQQIYCLLEEMLCA